MAALPTIAETIDIGYASISLAGNYNSKSSLFYGGQLNPVSPITILMTTEALAWGYNDGVTAQTDASLRATANYLLWLCGMFGSQAQVLIAGGGGGTVTPVTPGGVPESYQFIVTSSSFIVAGARQKTLPDSWKNRDILFIRNYTPQGTTNVDPATYYSWDRLNALLTLFGDSTGTNGAAVDTEFFQIFPI